MKQTDIRLVPSRRAQLAWIVAFCLCSLSGRVWAGGVLEQIPRDAAAVVVFPNLSATTQRVNTFLASAFPRAQTYSPEDALDAFDLPHGLVDFSAPVAIVASRPSFAMDSRILIFRSKDLNELTGGEPLRDGIVRTVDCMGQKRFLMTRDGTAVLASRRTAMKMFREPPGERPRRPQGPSPFQGEMATESDVFVYFFAPAWREQVRPFVSLATNAMKLGLIESARKDEVPLEEARVFADWAGAKVSQVIDEMQSLSLGVRFDGETLSLTHRHSFTRHGAVTKYLAGVKSSGLDFSSMIPDRRFVALFCMDWQTPADVGLGCQLMNVVLGLPAVAEKLAPEKRDKLLSAYRAMHEDTVGTYMLFGGPADAVFPLQVVGGNVVGDAARGLEQMQFIQERSSEVVSAFLPGLGYERLKFLTGACDGLKYIEAPMAGPEASETFRRDVVSMYGEGAALQAAALGERHLLYTIADGRYGVCEAAKAVKAGRTMSGNDAVRSLLSGMPKSSQMMALLDVGEAAAMLPAVVEVTLQSRLADAGEATAASTASTEHAKPPSRRGPMIGWCAWIEDGQLVGRASVAASDLPLIGAAGREMIQRIAAIKHVAGSDSPAVIPPQPPPPPEPRRPRPSSGLRSPGGG